jgi:hypothetical protein
MIRLISISLAANVSFGGVRHYELLCNVNIRETKGKAVPVL